MTATRGEGDWDPAENSVNIFSAKHAEWWERRQLRPLVAGTDVLPTYWDAWNECCRDDGGGVGLAMGWHVIVGGRTKSGKTLTAACIAASALEWGCPVGFVSLEMGVGQMTSRLYSIIHEESMGDLERGPNVQRGTVRSLAKNVKEDSFDPDKPGFWMNANNPPSMSALTGLVQHWIDLGCRMIVLDYMQLAAPMADSGKISERVTMISRSIQQIAYRRKVVTVGLSQLNREGSADEIQPNRNHLFGASGLANDADQVVLIDHSRQDRTGTEWLSWMLLDANRHGPSAEIPVAISKKTLRMRQAKPDEEGSWPK